MNRLGWLSVITLLGQILAFTVAPILTKYYNPEEIGQYKYYIGILGFFTTVGLLGYDRAIYKTRKKREKKYLILMSMLFSLLLIASAIITYLATDDSGWLFVALLLLPNIYIVLISSYHSSINNFEKLYLNKVTVSIAGPIIKFFVAILGFDIVFLYVSELLSRLSACYLTKEGRLFVAGKKIHSIFKYKKIVAIYKKFEIYPKKVQLGVLINSFSLFLPLFFIEKWYGYHYVGIYSLCVALTQTPFTVFGSNISIILQSKYRVGIEELRKVVIETLGIISCLYLVFPVFIYFNGDFIVDVLFKGNWVELKKHLFMMSTMGAIWGISYPFSVIFHLFEKQSILLRIHVLKFLCRFIALLIGVIFFTFTNFLKLFVVTSIVLHFFQLFHVVKVVNFDLMRLIHVNSISILILIAVAILVYVIKAANVSDYMIFYISFSLFTIISYPKAFNLVFVRKNI